MIVRRSSVVLFALVLLGGCGADSTPRSCRASRSAPEPAPRQKYALLINGDTERRHKENVANAYESLRFLGFTPNHIFVLSPSDRRAKLAPPTLRLAAVPDNFSRVMDELAGSVRARDLLVVYGTGHGDITEDGAGFLALRKGELWPDELRERIEGLGSEAVIVMDQCFSGAFADGFQGTRSRAIVVTSVDGRHETDCYYFAGAFWDAFLHPEEADRNHDGKTSVREAFEVAIKAHREGLAGDKELASDGTMRSFNGLEDEVLN